MTLLTTVPGLAEAIQGYLDEHPGCHDPWIVRDTCFEHSEAFQLWLDEVGITSDVISGVRMDGNVILQGHFAVLVGDVVVDFTYRQFDPAAPVPLITPYAEWRADWRSL